MLDTPYAVREFASWMRLCRGSRRRAHEYKRWARQAASEGRLDRYQAYREFSDNAWNDAVDALFRAKMIKERML